MGRRPGDSRVVFHRRQRVEDEAPLAGVAQPVLDTGRPVQRPLDRQQVPQAQPRVRYLAGDAGLVVEVGRGEQARVGGRVTVLAGRLVAGHHRRESGLIEVAAEEPVEDAGIPGDHGGSDDAARPDHAGGLGQGTYPVGVIRQVVQRAEQQDGVVAAVSLGQAAGVAGATETGRPRWPAPGAGAPDQSAARGSRGR